MFDANSQVPYETDAELMLKAADGDVAAFGRLYRRLGPILRGGRGWEPRDFVFAEFHGHQVPFEQRMVRDRRYKYIFNAPDVDELYDLETDPYEMVNRMADDTLADARRSLKEALYEWMKRVGDPIDRYFERSRMSRA